MAMDSSKEIRDTSSHDPMRQRPEVPTPEQRTASSDDDDVYPKQGQRRLALIFNQENFWSPILIKRLGTQSDKKSLQNCFQKYNFDIEPLKDDMKATEIKEKLTEVAKRDYSNTDCVAVVVLTHGEYGGYLAATDDWYTEKILIGAFNDCPSLTGKPKLFFIQACRGRDASRAARKPYYQADYPELNLSNMYSVPEEADVLVFYSTYEGKASFRDTVNGTWFIQDLCSELMKNGETDDLLTMLTRVNFSVASKTLRECGPEMKQMPVIQSCLTRKFYLANEPKLIETDEGISSLLDQTLDLLNQLDEET